MGKNHAYEPRLRRIGAVVVFLIVGLLCTVGSANAVTKTANSGANNWGTSGSWSPTGVPANGDAVVIPSGSTMTLNTNTNSLLSVSVTGTLTIGSGNTDVTITVTGNVTVNSGGVFQTAGNGGNIFILGGNLANAGTFDAVIGTATMNTTFNGSANQTVNGAGGTTHFNLITINNTGAANANIVEISSTNFTVPAGFLTLTDGIFKLSGSFTLSNTFFPSAAYTINSDEGIWLNNPNATVTAQAGDMNLSGLLRVSQGIYNVGNAANLGVIYATGSTIDIQGGALNIAGPLQGTTVSSLGTTNTTTYSQSGGTVSTATVGVTSSIASGGRSYGSFDIHATGSSFTMSAGTIVLANPTSIPNDYVVGAISGSVTGGLVQFGNASTTVPNRYLMTSTTPIFNLTIKDTVSPYAAMSISPLTVKGVVTIDAGADFRAQNLALSVAGNWINNGIFTPGNQTTTFNGTSGAQTISGSATTGFSSLTISNAAGVSLSSVDATVNAVLSLNSGDVTTGANFLNMAVGATSTGTPAPGTDVVGNVRRTHTFTTGTTYAFGNQFVSLNFTGAGTKPTAVNINLVKSVPTGTNFGFPTAVQRTYTVTPTAGTGYSATLRLHYLNSELNGNNENAADFDLWRHNGVDTWHRQVKTANNPADTANWAEKSGVTQFSAWTLAGGSPSGPGPTAVKLARFNAVSFADGVRLTWATGYEVNNLGFNVYREQNGQRTRVTPAVVAGSALTVGQGNRLTAGYSYSWFDQEGTPNTGYHLEAIDLNGSRQWAGPVYPYVASSSDMGIKGGRSGERALLLSELAGASRGNGKAAERGWPSSMSAIRDTEGGRAGKSKVTGLGVQQQIAAGEAVKIQVRKTGWYRLNSSELIAAGLDASTNARLLQLFVDGQEVPVRLNGEGSSLGDIYTLEFYGVAHDTPTTDTRTYWLTVGDTPGKRSNANRSKLRPGDLYWTGSTGVRSFDYTTERREKLIYSSFLLNGDAENIFGQLVYSDPVPQTLKVSHFDREAPGQGTEPQLEIALQGLSAQSHQVRVQFNGADVGTVDFAGSEHSVARLTVNRSLLVEGDNVVALRSTNGESDLSLVDWIRLTYAHRYIADNDELNFTAPAGRVARVDGFSNSNLRIVDVTNPSSPIELQPVIEPSRSGYSLRVQAADSERTLLAFADHLVETPAGIVANEPSNWNSSANGADMVIVTHKNFRQAIEPLANLRRNQGLVVAVVDVEDIYDEFSYGAHTPAAIKSFLMSAAGNWSRKPQYLLLVGDSSWDPRNYLNEGDNDFVPTKLIDTSFLETSSDDWLADFNGLGIADMALGRLPARTVAEANLMVAKIMSFEQERELNVPLRNAVMVADSGFETQSAETSALIPAGISVQTINRSGGNDDLTRSQIVDALNQGPMMVNYYGHGSVGVWTGAGLLDSNLATNLTNTNRLSLYVMMTCLNGYGHDVYIDSLAESALKAPNGGAVAVWASSGFTETQSQFVLDQAFYRQLFGSQTIRLGEAIRNAKALTSNSDVRRTWVLFGDPAMRMR